MLYHQFAIVKIKTKKDFMNMVRSLNFYIILGIILILCSCNADKQETSQIVNKINLSNITEKEVSIADVAEVMDIINLEMSDESLIYEIDKIEQHKDLFYILDKHQKKIFVFDKGGVFLRQIGELGSAPDEFQYISDFTIDKENDKIMILSTINSTYIFEYDLNGNFLSKKEISKSLLWSITNQDKCYICSSNNLTYTEGSDAFLLYKFDKNSQLLDKEISVSSKQIYSPMTISTPFHTANGVCHYVDCFNNRVYYISNDSSVWKEMLLNFSNPMPIDLYADVNLFMNNMHKYNILMEAYINNHCMLFTYIHEKKYYIKILSHKQEELLAGEFIGAFPRLFNGDDNVILSPINILEYESDWKQLFPSIEEPIAEDCNMMIVKWKIKC